MGMTGLMDKSLKVVNYGLQASNGEAIETIFSAFPSHSGMHLY